MIGTKAILIEDNRAVLETLSASLKNTYTLFSAQNGKQGLELIKTERPDLIILDLNLPDMSGLRICRETRRIGVKAPILILSGDSRLSTKLTLFNAGADDYLVKPFSLGELEARLSAMHRRLDQYKQMIANPRTSSLVLDRSSRSVIREGGQPITLRYKEYAILEFMIRNAGQTISRQRIIEAVWKDKRKPWSNAVDVHINSLRDKIDKPFDNQLIVSIHGVGYRLEAD
jgi:two-component system OmpR family response regulator